MQAVVLATSGMVSLQSRIASGVQACRTSTWPGAPWAAACPMARHRSATTGSARRQTNRMIRIGPSRACANLVAAPEISRCAQARRPVCGKIFCRLFGQRKLQFPAHQAKPRLMRGRFLARSSAQRRNAAFADFGRHVVERHMPAKTPRRCRANAVTLTWSASMNHAPASELMPSAERQKALNRR